ncbi:MAG: class I SAM-dependent methyltransferase [Pseudodesulfovibrio sp.]|nr:class I SAM-dependent methyltransferase [Pseudodesulfovibrio sp.]
MHSYGSCPICGCHSFDFSYSVTDTNQGVAGSWDVLVCKDCKLGVLSPRPTSEDIPGYYGDSFYTTDSKRFSGGVESIRGVLNRYKAWRLKKHLPSPGKLLDFGSGAGHFGSAMSSAGWDVSCEDISYSTECSRLRMDGEQPLLDYPNDYFDVVTLWYVIEHMLDPRGTLQEVRRVLKPDGTLVLSQQNFSSFQAHVFGPRWLMLDPPRHVYQFSPDNLKKLVVQEGFAVQGVDHHCLEMGTFTILQGILNCIFGNSNALFKLLKNRQLSNTSQAAKNEKLAGLGSLILTPILLPVAVAAYFVSVFVGSGDLFTLYLRKADEP